MTDTPTITEQLRLGLKPKGSAPIVRLQMGSNGFFNEDFVVRCLDELEQKTLRVAAGVDEFTQLEVLAIHLLKDSAEL